jgi:hypothetical protein
MFKIKKAISSWLAMMCNLKTNMVQNNNNNNIKMNNKTSHKNQSGHQSQWLKKLNMIMTLEDKTHHKNDELLTNIVITLGPCMEIMEYI